MGCDSYAVGSHHCLKFDELDDRVRCLCTFPDNDRYRLDPSRVRSLAYLGAAVILAHQEEFAVDSEETIYESIPHCLPDWVKTEIDRNIP